MSNPHSEVPARESRLTTTRETRSTTCGKEHGLGLALVEHVATLGLVTLPAYWYFWKNAHNPDYDIARKVVTVLIATMCWFLFLVGHVLNNVRGFGS